MIFSDLLTQVYRVLEDPGQFAWPNSAVAFHLNDAVRDVVNQLGLADARTTLNLVSGQGDYELPVGIRRIYNIRILPEVQAGGTQQEAGPPLPEVRQHEFEVVSVQEGEPKCYMLTAVDGAGQDRFGFSLAPVPDRNHTDGIIINHAIEYEYTSTDPANPTANAQIIPLPSQYNKIIVYKTASNMLSERDDESDIRRGEYLEDKAQRLLRPMLPARSLQSYRDNYRTFP